MKVSSKAPLRPLSYGRQHIDDADIQAVVEVLRGDWLTQGPAVERFEEALRARVGATAAVACANGTAALHLAALTLGWQPGDVVIVPAITFLASANCAVYVGAEPYFVDIDNATFTIDPNEVERAVIALRRAGRTVRAVVGVDMAGHPCDWPALRALADRFELQLVDDACHALGATYARGVRIGCCEHVDATVFSFHPVKHITTGEGGALLTNDAALAERARRLRSHGTVRGADHVTGWEGPWHYDMREPGFNYRLTDIQAALGLSQLAKLDRFVARRREIAGQYDRALADSMFKVPVAADTVEHAYHLYVVRAPFGRSMPRRREFFDECLARGLQLQVHYRPIPMNSWYRQRSTPDVMARLPRALCYYSEAASLPIYAELQPDDVARVTATLIELAA